MNTIRSVNSLADSTLSELMAANLIMFLDWGLLDKGGFANVHLNDSNINSANRSQLRKSSDGVSGKIWETFHQNLVWESGVSVTTQPINISGIYVNNTFYPTDTSGTYKHTIDYNAGRLIFTTPIPASSTVNMEYSYKTISVVEAKDSPYIREIQFRSFDPYNNGFSQIGSGEYNKSTKTRVALPLIGVEVTPRIDRIPHELGAPNFRTHITVLLHVLAETDVMVKKLVYILSGQKENTLLLLNTDTIAKSGAFPLNSQGYKNPNPQTYPNLLTHDEYIYNKTYVLESYGTNGDWVANNLYHGTVELTTETIL